MRVRDKSLFVVVASLTGNVQFRQQAGREDDGHNKRSLHRA